jgi:hypothetical protein
MNHLRLFGVMLIAAMMALASAAADAKSKSKASQANAKMTDEQVRAKCINDFQKSTGSTGPQTASQVMNNNTYYGDCVRRYGVRP